MKAALLFLAVFCIVGIVVGQRCPNNCSPPNGYCMGTGVCQCVANWVGIDCSVPDDPLLMSIPTRGRVSQGTWHYYHYTIPAGVAHNVTMLHELAAGTDADMYIRRGLLPNRLEYDYANTGVQARSTLTVPASTTSNTYYLGIYGYSRVTEYTVTLSTTGGTCPNDCSGHGRCDETKSECSCYVGWAGRSCNTQVRLAPNGYSSETVQPGNWVYYYVTIPTGSTHMRVIVNQTTPGDVDLYIKKGSVPSFASFDYADSSVNPNFAIEIPRPTVGQAYYIGFFGFATTSFQWVAQVGSSQSGCPNECSGPTHGTCNPSTSVCDCLPDFGNTTCSQMLRDLRKNEVALGHVNKNEWNYYSISTFSASPLSIEMNNPAGQDCDLYVQRNRNPSRFDFLYRDISYKQNVKLVIPNPLDANWKIGIMGYSTCNYNITAYTAEGPSTCPAECTANGGRCPTGSSQCICPEDKGGPTCSVPIIPIVSGQTISGNIAPNQWNYYRFSGPASAFSIVLHEDTPGSRAGVLWLYAAVLQAPQLTNYDWADTSTGTNTHRINVEIGQLIPQAHYYIGVFGSPFAVNSQNPYKITTWAAPFKK